MIKKTATILMAFVILLGSFGLEAQAAHNHNYVLYSKILVNSYSRQYKENKACTVTVNSYSCRYVCTGCDWGFTQNQDETHHSSRVH